eukprot:118458-Pyramimonas_sp.AAC.1
MLRRSEDTAPGFALRCYAGPRGYRRVPLARAAPRGPPAVRRRSWGPSHVRHAALGRVVPELLAVRVVRGDLAQCCARSEVTSRVGCLRGCS